MSPTPAMVDALFAITCPRLPVDHAYALSQAIHAALPWFAEEPRAGLHLIRAAESGSGWLRPQAAGDLLQLPQRTRLVLRLPQHRLDGAAALLGRTLDIAGHALRVERVAVRALLPIRTLLSHCVYLADGGEEPAFRLAAERELDALGIRPAEILCGLATPIATPARVLRTRSLMLAGLTAEQSMLLQQRGLGGERKLGCGLFIPHKAVGDLRSSAG